MISFEVNAYTIEYLNIHAEYNNKITNVRVATEKVQKPYTSTNLRTFSEFKAKIKRWTQGAS